MTEALTDAQRDRAAGVLVGQACGDALGVPYEFAAPPLGEPQMIGGGLGPYQPGEWSDDTQMAVCIAQVSATGADLTGQAALDEVAAHFESWLEDGASDVGIQTRTLLSRIRRVPGRRGVVLAEAAAALHAETGRTAGNGALMRTAVVGLTRLADREATAAAARTVAELTHQDPLAGDSCVLWSELARVAVLDGLPPGPPAPALDLLPEQRRDRWRELLDDVLTDPTPARFENNGYTVTALQAAWAALVVGLRGPEPVRDGLIAAVGAGNDTDTIGAIAGGVLGAAAGLSGIPDGWVQRVHGWPGMRAAELAALGVDTAVRGRTGA